MKQFFYIGIFSLFSLTLFSQDISIMNDENGQPSSIIMKMPDTTYIHNFVDGVLPDNVVMGEKYMVSPKELFEHGDYSNHDNRGDINFVEPGVMPEGDLPYRMQYTNDGTKLIAMYYHTNNLIVYNAETYESLANIYVGEGPIDMEITDEHIYVCCYFSDEIYIINTDDYSIENSFSVEHQPCVISVNSDESIIYVGFDNDVHLKAGGFMAAYDLNDFNQMFSTYWPYIGEIYMIRGWVGRKMYTYSDFKLIGNDNYIACLQTGAHTPIILNAITGEVEKSYSYYNTCSLVTTESKDSLYFFALDADSLYFYCVDSYTLNTVDSFVIPNTYNQYFWNWFDNIKVDVTGSKLFFEAGSLIAGNYGYFIDFGAKEYKVMILDDWFGVQYYNLQSYDQRYVVMPGESFRIFDFVTEEYVYDQNNLFGAFRYASAISPISYDFVVCDNRQNYYGTNFKRDEYIDVYNFSDPTNIIMTDSIFCGQLPEADLVWSAAINNHHNKIITGNPLSANISIIDAITYEVDTIIDIEHISSVKSINDDLVVLSGYSSPYLILFDLSTLSIIKQFDIEKYFIIIPSPDQQYLYAYNRAEGLLAKIHIDGENSYVETITAISDNASFYINTEYSYNPEISPDGMYILFNENSYIKILNTETMKLETEVHLSGSHIHDMAFTDDSRRVCFAYWFSTPVIDILYLDGENSYLENTISTGDQDGGMSVEYNPVDGKFYFAKKLDIWKVDPETAIVEDTINLNVEQPQVQIGIDPQGNPIVNTIRYFYYNGKEYFMKEPTRKFTVDYESSLCIIPQPGPDRVCILDLLSTEMHEVAVSKADSEVNIYPVPAIDKITIESGILIDRIEIFTVGGDKLMDKKYRNSLATIDLSSFSNGVYIVKVHQGTSSISKKVLVNCKN